ncbi:hypothetical protein ILUMI_19344 [Ignelater luminosus]|uniref:Uncharacterized protein n=1 Tax=Ignelater luminosus TaxID=2038154 RepID=A0A8K0G004_IGNLU|nr:hypothetical protein ILUMI_19344 [Ignelater luminosus]
MSGGPSRDRDIGKKWKSGASKRKRKAETVLSNQAMSFSIMKFLKKPCSGITAPESFDESHIQLSLVSETEPASESKESVTQISDKLDSEKICDSENQEQADQLRESFSDLDPEKAHRESLNFNDSGDSGNLIDLFKLLSKYDLTLREHLQRINEEQLNQHYLSHNIQNELITLMSKSGVDKIVHRVKQQNTTPSCSIAPRISIILRFCNSSTGAIEEHFVGKRWDHIKTKLKLTLESLSETRWESRIGAVKAIFLQFDDVIECVNDLKNKTDDSESLSDCKAVWNEMLTFELNVAIHVWYEILLRVNNISKLWQSVQVNLKVAIDTLRSFCSWIQEFRNTGFEKSVAEAPLLVGKISYEIESQFKEKRIAKEKRMFGYEHIDESIQSVEMQYRVNFFNKMIDAIIVDTECRFKALNEYYERFGFIYDIDYLKSIPKEDFLKHCNDLGTILREGENRGIQPYELYDEL